MIQGLVQKLKSFLFLLLAIAFSVVFGASSASAKSFLSNPTAKKHQPVQTTTVPADKTLDSQLEGPVTPVVGDKVRKITITGQRKIEKDAIVAKIKTKEGGTYNEESLREDVVNLFKTGYFNDVQISRTAVEGEPNTYDLTYNMVEKPSVGEIDFEGNSEIKADDLLETTGLKVYEILNVNKINEAVEKIQKSYEDKGYFLAKVEPKIEDIKKDETVKVTFQITESDKVKVQKITFLGTHSLKDGYLKSKLQTTEGGFFSFISGGGAYKQDIFDRDVQLLKYLYFNEGYIQVKIDRPQVYVTPDKKSIYITFRIEEGEQFDVGEVDFSGDLLFSKEELSEGVQINKKTVFSWETLQKDVADLQAKYGDLGYAFANVIPKTRTNEKDRKVDINFEFEKGNKVYFGKINVIGNTRTRDKVIRREIKVHEGELYNETNKRKSLENIQRLGFFEEHDGVVFKTSTPPETPDILNLDIVVKERNTGQIQFSAGYGSASGFIVQGQINQTNFMGKGQRLGAGVSVSSISTDYNFNFTEPHFMDTDWSLGFDAYQNLINKNDYYERKLGAAVRLGHPVAEYMNAFLRYKYEDTRLTPIYYADGTLETDYTIFPLSTASGSTGSITGILEYDKRNDRFSPSRGDFASLSYEYAGIGGDLKYVKGNADYKYFQKLFWELVWRNNLSYSFLSSYDPNSAPPFNELYLLGGPYNLRGYRFLRVGKRVFSQNTFYNPDTIQQFPNVDNRNSIANKPFGGQKQFLYQTEFEFPLITEAGIKGVTFYDLGQAEDEITDYNFYADLGFGIRWYSPIGPLRFEWGFPMRKTDASPDTVIFEFSLGTPF